MSIHHAVDYHNRLPRITRYSNHIIELSRSYKGGDPMALYVASYIIGLSGKSIISEAGRESPQCLESLKSKPRHEAVYIKMPDISLAHEMRILGLGIIIVIANQKNKWIFVANGS